MPGNSHDMIGGGGTVIEVHYVLRNTLAALRTQLRNLRLRGSEEEKRGRLTLRQPQRTAALSVPAVENSSRLVQY